MKKNKFSFAIRNTFIAAFSLFSLFLHGGEIVDVTDETELVYLSYIQSQDAATIDTTYLANANTYVEFKGMFVAVSGTYNSLFAEKHSGEAYNSCRVIGNGAAYTSVRVNCCTKTSSSKEVSGVTTQNTGKVLEGYFSQAGGSINGVSVPGNTEAGTAHENPVLILGNAVGKSIRLYYIRFKENDVAVHDFQPCAYNGEFGMYDKVTKKFHPKMAGLAGTISAGASFSLELEKDLYPLQNGEARPDVTVKDLRTGEVLVKDVDYTVSYSGNTAAGTGTLTVTASGSSGACFGSDSATFEIYEVGEPAFSSAPAVSFVKVDSAITSQPHVNFTLGGSGEYDAKAEIYVSADGGEYERALTIPGLKNGSVVSRDLFASFPAGTKIKVKVFVSIADSDFTIQHESDEITCDYAPPSYGFALPVDVVDATKLLYLSYVISDGKAPVYTEYIAHPDTLVEFKAAYIKVSGSYNSLFKDYVSANHNTFRIIGQGANYKSFYYNCCWITSTSASANNVTSSNTGEDIEGYFSRSGGKLNNVTLVAHAFSAGTDNTCPMILLSDVSAGCVRMHYIRFKNRNTQALEADFHPAVYNGAVGMYDSVGNRFYPQSLGAGTLSGDASYEAVFEEESYPLVNSGTCPEVVVTDRRTGNVLQSGVDYVVTYADNTAPGTASATITPVEGSQTCYGTKTVTFGIHPVGLPSFVSDPAVSITFPYGTTQPHVYFKLGGEGDFIGTAQIYASADSSSYEKVLTVENLSNGSEASVDIPRAYATGTKLKIKVVVSITGNTETLEAESDEITLEEDPPANFGKGGGEGVVHIRKGAHGDGSGSDWFNAMTSFTDIEKALALSPREIWLCGDFDVESTIEKLTPSASVAIRGGFTGLECSKDERTEGARSVIDGKHSYPTMRIENGAGITVEFDGFDFCHSYNQGLKKTGDGDITIVNCGFYDNFRASALTISVDSSVASDIVMGHAAYLLGKAGVSVFSISNCTFAGNHFVYNGQYTPTVGLRLQNAARAYIDDSRFVTNGVDFTVTNFNTPNRYGQTHYGDALGILDVPVTVRGCEFRGNRGIAWHASANSNYQSGGIVYMRGNCGGSAFSNCIWIANANDQTSRSSNPDNTLDYGAVSINLSGNSDSVDFMNCTFTGNICESINSPSALFVRRGTVGVSHCLFDGNTASPALSENAGTDIYAYTNGTVNIEWSVFDTPVESAAKSDCGNIVIGSNVIYNPYNTATTRDDYMALTVTNANSVISYDPARAHSFIATASGHLCGGRGYIDEKTGELVLDFIRAKNSGALDAGNPAMPYSSEPSSRQGYNGGRVNIGAYGNTPWATMSTYPGAVIRLR